MMTSGFIKQVSQVDVDELNRSGTFDPDWYAARYPDVALLGLLPAVHFLKFGRLLGRPGHPGADGVSQSPAIALESIGVEAQFFDGIGSTFPAEAAIPAALGRPDHPFMKLTDKLPADDRYPITNFMHYVWTSRLDLQKAFSLTEQASRVAYCEWFLIHGGEEYGMRGWAYPPALLDTLSRYDGAVGEKARRMQADDSYAGSRSALDAASDEGANLIGYARGEFGMGEHVRAVAEALNVVDGKFSIINVPETGVHGENDLRVENWISDRQEFDTNIFHINADVLPSLYFRFGPEFFEGRYNIGYWAWELANCPPEFGTAMTMMDEIWGISRFVTDSFEQLAHVPVINMPLAVELPPIEGQYSKKYFGIDEEEFVFLFTFDAASYLDRKNPLALIRAFKRAFPRRSEKARLLLKTMNIPATDPLWKKIAKEAAADPRITIFEKRLKRDEVLGLYVACDSFVSLHRSEGFGRCLTEAMLLGKPVVATGYSGSSDFIREDTACVVDYSLVSVEDGVYPFWRDQVWAAPDIDHAASQMRRLFDDERFRKDIASAGQRFVRENFNSQVIGARYAERLEQIRKIRLGWRPAPASPANTAVSAEPAGAAIDQKAIYGNLDSPPEGIDEDFAEGGLQISGWVTGGAAVSHVAVHCDGQPAVDAHYGFLRPDIAAVHSGCVDAARSGFGYLLDVTKLKPGKHRIVVRADTEAGSTLEWTRTVRIRKTNDSYAKWRSLQVQAKAPLVSFLVAYDPASPSGETLLRSTIASLNRQYGVAYEILLATPTGRSKALSELIATLDPGAARRLLAVKGVNRAIDDSKGEFISILHAGDVLEERALSAFALNVASHADVDLIYGDEEIATEPPLPRLKPGWSPLYQQRHNYLGRPFFLRAGAARDARRKFGSSEIGTDDLLRIGASTVRKVIHIPAVMARTVPSEAPEDSKATPTVHGDWPGVSIVIPTRLSKLPLAEACFQGLMDTDYPNFEVIVVANNMVDREFALNWIRRWPFKILEWDGSYNWSALNNFGVQHASHELLLFLNDDIEPLNRDWLKSMVSTLDEPGVGAVGALLKYPNGLIQHAGMNLGLGAGEMHHTFRLHASDNPALSHLIATTREHTAVTGACLLTRRSDFEAVGCFDERLPIVCNDADYCFRIAERGLSIVLESKAQLTHYEGISRAGYSETADVRTFSERWKAKFGAADPFMNPNLDFARNDWSINPSAHQSWIGRVFQNSLFNNKD